MQESIHHRFEGASYYENSKNEVILIAGLGGIGSNTAYSLCKSVPASYLFIDDDVVEIHNVGTQHFDTTQLGISKVSAMKRQLTVQGVNVISIFERKILPSGDALPITIAAFDNMAARKQLFEDWLLLPDRELFIDGRLRASYFEIYAVIPGKEDDYMESLFDDNEVVAATCTYKQTTYFGALIGARITQIVVNYLTNKYSEVPFTKVPFKITNIGELFKEEIVWK